MNVFTKMCIVMLAFAFFLVGETRAEEATNTKVAYTVKRGDRLATIARQFGTNDYLAIAAINRISNPDLIYPGQILTLPFVIKTEVKAVAPMIGACATNGIHARVVAHSSLPLGTTVCILNSQNGRSVIARVNDRKPERGGRIINVSQEIAQTLDFIHSGTAHVAVFIVEVPTTVGHPKSMPNTLPRRKAMGATQAGAVTNDRMTTKTVITPPRITPGYVKRDKATDLTMFFMSEVVVTEFGPAHVIDGLNENRITPRDAIAQLFKEEPAHVRSALLAAVENDQYVETTLEVGDRLPLMLTAEGVVFHDVLEAQMSDTGLSARCYVFKDEASEHDYRLIRERRSGNWYAEIFSPRGQENNSCANKERSETR